MTKSCADKPNSLVKSIFLISRLLLASWLLEQAQSVSVPNIIFLIKWSAQKQIYDFQMSSISATVFCIWLFF